MLLILTLFRLRLPKLVILVEVGWKNVKIYSQIGKLAGVVDFSRYRGIKVYGAKPLLQVQLGNKNFILMINRIMDLHLFDEPIYNYKPGKDFTTLVCWKDVRQVKLFFYQKVLPKLPSSEKFNLDIQIRKASCSTTANIAEGYGRFHYQELGH